MVTPEPVELWRRVSSVVVVVVVMVVCVVAKYPQVNDLVTKKEKPWAAPVCGS